MSVCLCEPNTDDEVLRGWSCQECMENSTPVERICQSFTKCMRYGSLCRNLVVFVDVVKKTAAVVLNPQGKPYAVMMMMIVEHMCSTIFIITQGHINHATCIGERFNLPLRVL